LRQLETAFHIDEWLTSPGLQSPEAKVIHPQARDNYRVILKDDGLEVEVGSIGISARERRYRILGMGHRHRYPDAHAPDQGRGTDRADCMRWFKEAWERFAGDPANLTEFVAAKRRARRTRNPP
jgi:hypothetical protein